MSNESKPTKTTTLTMAILAWVMGLSLLVWWFNQWTISKTQAKIAESAEAYSVSLPSTQNGHFLAKGQINGTQVTFLVDTGASNISIPEDTAQQLGLTPGFRHPVITANGQVMVYQTQIDHLRIGPIYLRNLKANINPGMNGEQEILLGMNALKQLEFSHSDGWLTIKQYR